MEWLDGKPFSKALEETRPIPVVRLVHIAHQIADALSSAHQRGIVHRDLKPDNIFLIRRGTEQDFVKILDFGIAKVSSGTSKLTRAGSVFGTPHYMSPEQAAGAPVDSRTDIYALGVILYEMASGRVPFDADNFMGILTQHMYKAPVPIRALVPPQDVPPGLEAIILKALSKKPEQRYQTMDEVGLDLDKLTRGMIPDAVPEMMSRSGGFNVPADFFKERGMAAPVPATPIGGSRGRWGVYAGVAGVVAAIAIVVAIFAKSSSSTASTNLVSPAAVPASPPARTHACSRGPRGEACSLRVRAARRARFPEWPGPRGHADHRRGAGGPEGHARSAARGVQDPAGHARRRAAQGEDESRAHAGRRRKTIGRTTGGRRAIRGAKAAHGAVAAAVARRRRNRQSLGEVTVK